MKQEVKHFKTIAARQGYADAFALLDFMERRYEGDTVAMAYHLGVTPATIYNWRAKRRAAQRDQANGNDS